MGLFSWTILESDFSAFSCLLALLSLLLHRQSLQPLQNCSFGYPFFSFMVLLSLGALHPKHDSVKFSFSNVRDITLPTKFRLVKAMVFPVVMYGCESWTIKKAECRRIDAFELWC